MKKTATKSLFRGTRNPEKIKEGKWKRVFAFIALETRKMWNFMLAFFSCNVAVVGQFIFSILRMLKFIMLFYEAVKGSTFFLVSGNLNFAEISPNHWKFPSKPWKHVFFHKIFFRLRLLWNVCIISNFFLNITPPTHFPLLFTLHNNCSKVLYRGS